MLEPPGRWSALKLGELWHYRELLYILAWRDVMVRYKQALLGVAWAVLQPLVMMGIFTLLFSRIANVPTGGVPYPVFAFAALVPWTMFASAAGGLGRQPRRQPEPGVEGLLPEARHPRRGGVRLGPGLRDRLGVPVRDHGDLRVRAALHRRAAARR